VATAQLRHRESEHVDLVATRTVTRTVRRGEPATIRVVGAPEELDGPLPARARVGTIEVRWRGRTVDRVALVTATAVAEAGFGQRLDDVLGRTVLVLGLGAFALASLQLLLLRRRARRRRSARTGGTEIA
jgi:serine-type D-Ala-D-Ala carboxypeptidase (penicillin-binding protein 5/6)